MRFALLTGRGLVGLSITEGARDRSEIQFLINGTSSPNQWQLLSEFQAVFLMPDQAYGLDYAGLESVIQYLAEYNPNSPLRQHLIQLQDHIRVKPQPEPEVRASKPKAEVEPEPEPDPVDWSTYLEEDKPKWRARVRTKFRDGPSTEVLGELENITELLEQIVRNSGDDVKNIKIKLEYGL